MIPPQTICSCLICNKSAYPLKLINGYQIFRCSSCGVEFCNPMPSSSDLDSFYQNYSDVRASPDVTRLNAQKNIKFLCQKYHISEKTLLLDYGCGQNLFIEACKFGGIAGSHGYDPYRTSRFSLDECKNHVWNCITLWGVLEHLTDPVSTLSELGSWLDDQGIIALTTVCSQTGIPYQHKPPEHTLYFTKESIELLAVEAGLFLVEFRPYTMWQDSDLYLSILLRTVPQDIQKRISHSLNKYVEVPTNEVMIVFEKKRIMR